jgi:alkanesulfonate monooxygenase SsuD/methylene tetrahydromethanopterin reductase-like flavin-dependent oxidoreductase (luciferase family)
MRAAWSQRVSSHDGPTVHFDGIAMEPKPVRGSIPIVVGGHTPPATRRAGRLGDGFFPLGCRGQPLRDLVNAMRRSAAAAGRDPASIEITAEAPRTADEAQAIRELGVHRVVVNAPHVETAEVPGALAARMTRVRDVLGS